MTADDEDFLLLSAYRDGELSPRETLDIERRLAADPALRTLAARLGTLSDKLRDALATPAAPTRLHAVVAQRFGAEERPRRTWRVSLQPLAAVLIVGLLAGGAIGSGATYLSVVRSNETATEAAVLDGHLRGLAAPLPFDIASSNQHVVKPWFNGRTTIAPEAPDLAEQGFPLAGGRIDVIGGKPMPTLVYRRDQHLISVTVTPRVGDVPMGDGDRDGYGVVHWNVGDVTYWCVSDLDPQELRTFIDLFRAKTAS